MNSKDFSEILELSKNLGGKYIIVENNQPSYVLMNIKEYKDLTSNCGNAAIEDMSKEELIEKINKDIASWRSGQKEEEIDDHFLSSGAEEDLDEETEYYYDIDKDF